MKFVARGAVIRAKNNRNLQRNVCCSTKKVLSNFNFALLSLLFTGSVRLLTHQKLVLYMSMDNITYLILQRRYLCILLHIRDIALRFSVE